MWPRRNLGWLRRINSFQVMCSLVIFTLSITYAGYSVPTRMPAVFIDVVDENTAEPKTAVQFPIIMANIVVFLNDSEFSFAGLLTTRI